MTGLLPCPFCGSPARIDVDGDHHGDYFSLGCIIEDCLGHHALYTESELTPTQGIEKWNTRQQSAADKAALLQAQGEIKLLGEYMDDLTNAKVAQTDELVKAEAEIAALRKDAARWRYVESITVSGTRHNGQICNDKLLNGHLNRNRILFSFILRGKATDPIAHSVGGSDLAGAVDAAIDATAMTDNNMERK